MKKILFLILCCWGATAQVGDEFPVFPDCAGQAGPILEQCFYSEVQDFVFDNFKSDESRADVIVVFEVNREGRFVVQYVDAPKPELEAEARRVFSLFPVISPPKFEGRPTYARYTFRIKIPFDRTEPIALSSPQQTVVNTNPYAADQKDGKTTVGNPDDYRELTEYDSIVRHKFSNPQFKSHLNIPFSHSFYAQFDRALNQLGANNHTGSKPFTYTEVSKYYDLDGAYAGLYKNRSGWWGRKLWNENLVEFQGDGYWFTFNPIFDLRLGKNTPGDVKSTYVNTRGIQFQGGIGRMVNFSSTIFESQGRFADYYNQYIASLAAAGGTPGIVPGIGIAKTFKTDSFDFPLAEAQVTFTPDSFFDLQLGYGRNFIGDGYRSLLMADGASPYPFFKINTKFWKFKYTNTYMWMRDVRPEVTEDRTYETKYMANHYLSWNVTKRLNLGFFESVVWANTNGRGFDANFINPIIFYRAVEFSSSARSGNALLGLTGKYKVNNRINLYGQFLLDEFSLNDVKEGNQSWKNKFGYQLGAKYFDALGVKNLLLQMEYNHVRPYVYAHSDPLTNYAHNNQGVGHMWGGNFREVIAVARYWNGRWFADAKLTLGTRGLDFDTFEDSFNYGGNIFKDYEEDRPYNTNVKIGQGNKTQILIADFQAGYLINPQTNLKLFASVIHRNFDPSQETLTAFSNATTWFQIGLRSDIFNWYFDY